MKNKTAGFALMEAVVAIVILGIVLVGAVGLITTAINEVARNRDRLTATYLTQECLELARNVRDSAWKQNLPWDCAFESVPISECQQNLSEEVANIPGKGNPSRVEVGGELSKFNRELTVTTDGPQKMKVTCEVSWPKKSGTNRITISEILTDWRKK